LYECTKIQTAYYNNINAHFENKLHGLKNELFKKKEKVESLRGGIQAYKSSSKVIKEAIRKKIYRPCNEVKLAIVKKEMPEVGLLDDQSRTQLNGFLSSYREEHTFQKNLL
jgi:Arc/MetJ-type ribon-helix-helix transcriptional regulator